MINNIIIFNNSINNQLQPSNIEAPEILEQNPILEGYSSSDAAAIIFHLFNAQYINFQSNSKTTSSFLPLSFLIQELETLLDHPKLKEERHNLEELIISYRCSYTVGQWFEHIATNKDAVRGQILDYLKKHGWISIPTGYAAEPSGHRITLYLTLEEKRGKTYVKGKIANLGEGLNNHLEHYIGATKTYYEPWLELDKVPLAKLESTPFFDLLLELQQLTHPDGEKTYYCIEDFYNILLPAWPGMISMTEHPMPATKQRTGDCSLKPYLVELNTKISVKTARFIKLHLTKKSIELLLEHPELTQSLYKTVEETLQKLMRRALKLQKKGDLNEKEIQEYINFTLKSQLALKKIHQDSLSLAKQHTLDFSLVRDLSEEGELIFTQKTPLVLENSVEKIKAEAPVATHWIATLVKDAAKSVNDAMKKSDYNECMRLIIDTFEKLPPATDLYWKTQMTPKVMKGIKTLHQRFHYVTEYKIFKKEEHIYITPTMAIIALKAFAITVASGSMLGLPQDFVHFFAGSLLKRIEEAQNHYRPLTPFQANEYRSSLKILKEASQLDSPTLKITTPQLDQYGIHHSHVVSSQQFETPRDVFNDPYIKFLNTLITEKNEAKFEKFKRPHATREYLAIHHMGLVALNNIGCYSLIDMYELSILFFYLSSGVFDTDSSLTQGRPLLDKKKIPGYVLTVFKEWGIEKSEAQTTREVIEGLFLSAHHRLADPKVLDELLSSDLSNIRSQNELLSLTPKSKKIAPPLFKDLLLGRLYPDLAVPLWIDYLSQHTNTLQAPTLQAFLSLAIFARIPGTDDFVIEKVMRDNSLIKERLFEFLRSRIKKTATEQFLDIHFLYLRVYVHSLLFAKEAGVNLESEISFLKTRLETLLTSKKYSEEARQLIGWQLTALFTYLRAWGDELTDFCNRAYNLVKEIPITTDSEVISQEYRYAEHILSHLDLQQKAKIPSWIISDSKFPYRTITSIKTSEDKLSFINEYQERIYLTFDEEKKEFYLHQKFTTLEGNIALFTLADKPPTSSVFSYKNHPCVDGCLASQARYFVRIDDKGSMEAVCTDLSGKEILARMDSTKIYPANADRSLHLMTNLSAPPPICTRIFPLYGQKETLCYKNEHHEIVKISIPKYDLHFTRDLLRTEQWYCSKLPGYFLDENDQHPTLEPHSHYLRLKSKTGSGIILTFDHLLPHERSIIPPEDPCLMKSKAIPRQHPRLLIYPLDSTGKIKPSQEVYESLYLIYLTLMKKDYTEAQELILKLKRLGKEWGEEECNLFNLFNPQQITQKDRDFHPAAAALRLQLKIIEHASVNEMKLSENQLLWLKKDYLNYIDQWNNTMLYRLSEQDEKILLRLISTKNELECLQLSQRENKYAELKETPLYHQTKITPSKNKSQKTDGFTWLNLERFQTMKTHLLNPLPITSHLRPGPNFTLNFLYYYNLLYGSEAHEKQEVIRILQCCAHDPHPESQDVRQILLELIKNPSKMPELQKIIATAEKDIKKLPQFLKDLLPGGASKASSFSEVFLTRTRNNTWTIKQPLEPTLPCSLSKIPQRSHLICEKEKLPKILINKGCLLQQDNNAANKQKIENLQNLKVVFSSIPTDSPCVKRASNRLIEGIEEMQEDLSSEKAQISYHINLDKKSRKELFKQLTLHHEIQKTEMILYKKKIYESFEIDSPLLKAEQLGGLLPSLKFREILLAVINDDATQIHKALPTKIPSLLTRQVTRYLLAATQKQHYERALKNLEDLNQAMSDGEKTNTADNKLVHSLLAKRAYTKTEDLYALFFEYASNIRLRKEQYTAYQELSKTDHLENIQLEAPTGFGKSSTVIALWLLKISHVHKTALMTLPPALLPSVLAQLYSILGTHFDKSFFVIKFERNQGNNFAFLKKLNTQLDDAQRKNKILLISIDHLHRLTTLQLKQNLHEYGDLSILRELVLLRKTLKFEISSFVDESKECFDVRHRYDYAIGAPIKISQNECQKTDLIYNMLLTEEILEQFNFEFLPEFFDLKKKSITIKNYTKKLLPLLASKAINILQLPEEIAQIALQDLKEIKLTDADRLRLNTFLDQHPLIKKEYRHFHKQLNLHLKNTLNRNCGEHYALIPEASIPLARPMRHGKIKKNSEFSTLDELKNFTVQANLKVSLKQSQVANFIFQLAAHLIDHENTLEPSGINAFYQLIAHQLKLPTKPKNLNAAHISTITEFLNDKKNIKYKIQFITQTILPQIIYYNEKASSGSFQLIDAIKQVNSASGTVDPDVLPPSVRTIEKKSAPIGNLFALWQHSQERIYINKGSTPKEILEQIIDLDPHARVIPDGGTLTRGLSEKEITTTILEKTKNAEPPVNGVAFFDDEGKLWVQSRNGMSAMDGSDIPLKELFIFIRQSNCLGADLTMLPCTRATITINRYTPLDFLIQTAGRMRGLQLGQTCSITCTEEDAQVIKDFLKIPKKADLTLTHIFQHAAILYGEIKGLDYFFTLNRFLANASEQIFWNFLDKNTPAQARRLSLRMDSLLVSSTSEEDDDDDAISNSEIDISLAVEHLQNSYRKKLMTVQKNVSFVTFPIDQIFEEFNRFLDYDKLPSKIMMKSAMGEECSVDIDADTDIAADQEMESQADSEASTITTFIPAQPVEWNEDYADKNNYKQAESQLGIKIFHFPNGHFVSDNEETNRQVRKSSIQCLIMKDRVTQEMRYAPLDAQDAHLIYNSMLHKGGSIKAPSDPYHDFYLMSGGKIIAFDAESSILNRKDAAFIKISILNKVQRGLPFLNQKELTLIETLLREYPADKIAFINFVKEYQAAFPQLKSLTTWLQNMI
ncbi:MAG: DUF3638 domain-containing protein [Chlamydiota bacterium]